MVEITKEGEVKSRYCSKCPNCGAKLFSEFDARLEQDDNVCQATCPNCCKPVELDLDEITSSYIWSCRNTDCNWVSEVGFEPDYTEKPCGCCYDFICPKCGGPVNGEPV